MIKDGVGGANTLTGLAFEGKTDLSTFLGKQKGYKVEKDKVYYKDELVARVFKKHQFYSFLEEYNINWKEIISKQLLPDDCIYVIVDNTLFIIECKFQQVAGSVDEKLQTCDFKKKQYQKLLSRANIEVEYVYLLSDWFKKPQYKDVLDYIISVRCQYYFEYIPLKKLWGQLLLVVPLCILEGGINLKYKPEQFELEETTIWSFKERGNWATHRGDYRGNCPPQVPRNLIMKYTNEGDIVLDTFCGSGTTMIETKLLNRKGVRNRCEYRST